MRTRAAVMRSAQGPFTIEQVELDDPGPGELLIRIAGTGLCHTDLLARHMPDGMMPLPAVFGHEGSGVVEAVGPGVTSAGVGDHVVLSYDSCGACGRCRSAQPAYCDSFLARNISGRRPDGSTPLTDDGGLPLAGRWFGQSSFAGHALAGERNTVVVDRSLPLELLGPLGCGIQTGAGSVLLGLGVHAGSSIVVFGTGAVGLAAVMAARAAGAGEIIAVDLHPGRRELALELGATLALDGADPDLAKVITARTGGTDFALDTTAVPAVAVTALNSLRAKGVCALVGAGSAPLTLPPDALSNGRSLTYLMEGDAVPQTFIPRLIDMWSRGRFPFDRLIRTYPLDAVNDAERDSLSGACVKPVLVPGGPS
ncbi:NAD(P)-dependent alcohol dehydrogenase [Streptomyces sp. NPDC059629]|uniref:NAD(P)-dependent alcohol dehydrogenase n=1 Tax=Streptomyces sp. NPDC059629 TaxID=3346889 RepID=UPI00369B5600